MSKPTISLFALLIAIALLILGSAEGMSTAATNKNVQKKVAVIGTTGRLGRQAVMKLSAQGIPTKCLLRHDVSSLQKKDEKPPLQLQDGMDSRAIAWYLSTLPHVEMVQGDVTDQDSVKALLQDCTAVLALYGAGRVSKLTDLFPWSNPETDPTHPRQVNYEGLRNIIQAAKESKTCKRIVRITGTQNPNSIPAILINMFGSFAKAWNYEGEELLRQQTDVDYTIIRPGVMSQPDTQPVGKVLALGDNGNDLKVTPIRHSDVADLCLACLDYDNAARATLSAMKVQEGQGEETYGVLLEKVRPDVKNFPFSQLEENKRAVRKGVIIVFGVLALLMTGVAKGIAWIFL